MRLLKKSMVFLGLAGLFACVIFAVLSFGLKESWDASFGFNPFNRADSNPFQLPLYRFAFLGLLFLFYLVSMLMKDSILSRILSLMALSILVLQAALLSNSATTEPSTSFSASVIAFVAKSYIFLLVGILLSGLQIRFFLSQSRQAAFD